MMPARKTVAIVGATEKNGIELSSRFADSPYRLLLISNDMARLSELFTEISSDKPYTEIEMAECVKDGCWEADIIILAVEYSDEKQVAELMKEVATQKIVVSVSDERNPNDELQQVLPYSKIVKASFNHDSNEVGLSGDDENADREVADIFQNAGYTVELPHHFS